NVQQFISRDRVETKDANDRRFVGNNPANAIDPSGLAERPVYYYIPQGPSLSVRGRYEYQIFNPRGLEVLTISLPGDKTGPTNMKAFRIAVAAKLGVGGIGGGWVDDDADIDLRPARSMEEINAAFDRIENERIKAEKAAFLKRLADERDQEER